MSIFITGDCHGNFKKFTRNQREKLNIQSDDYVIVCGDFGLLWSDDKEFKYNLDFFSNLPFTILWVGGNHENYNMIEFYTISIWHGGKVRHIIQDKVIYLERGEIYNIEGKSFFCLGGASSHDIFDGILDRSNSDFKSKLDWLKKNKRFYYRILNESWWSQELPSENELNYAMKQLSGVDDKVDYIISHCCSSEVEELLGHKEHDRLTDFFNYVDRFVEFKHWYFGHYHQDADMYDGRHTVVHNKFIKL